MCKAHKIVFSLSLGVQELSESNVIPNSMKAWNGKKEFSIWTVAS